MCFKHLSLVPRITKQPWITSRIIYVAKNSMARSSKTTHLSGKHIVVLIKEKVQRECCKAYYKYITSLTDTNGSITKRLWTQIKNQRKDNCGAASLKHNGKTYN